MFRLTILLDVDDVTADDGADRLAIGTLHSCLEIQIE